VKILGKPTGVLSLDANPFKREIQMAENEITRVMSKSTNMLKRVYWLYSHTMGIQNMIMENVKGMAGFQVLQQAQQLMSTGIIIEQRQMEAFAALAKATAPGGNPAYFFLYGLLQTEVAALIANYARQQISARDAEMLQASIGRVNTLTAGFRLE
jgi:hypothetical protein